MTKKYDIIIAGGGASGMCLAYFLTHSRLKPGKIAIVDRNFRKRKDRSWSYWTNQTIPFEHLAKKSWHSLQVFSNKFERVLPLHKYTISELSSNVFYEYIIKKLQRYDVDFIEDYITEIKNAKDSATVRTEKSDISAKWVFDSTFHWDILNNSKSLYMCGEVWKIKTEKSSFDPAVMTFFDFRGKHNGPFFYVMPYSETEASITCTQIDSIIPTLQPEYFNNALKNYIEKTLRISKYSKVSTSVNVIPLTDYAFPRKVGNNIMTIGAKGGRIKALTGYGYTRIIADSEQIVRSLITTGQPFYAEDRSPFYRMIDVFSIRAMKRKPSSIENAFTQLVAKNTGDDILGFLDESNSFRKNIEILKKVNPLLFF